jgi:hypothetical protein
MGAGRYSNARGPIKRFIVLRDESSYKHFLSEFNLKSLSNRSALSIDPSSYFIYDFILLVSMSVQMLVSRFFVVKKLFQESD